MKSPQFTLYPLCFFWTIGIVSSFYFSIQLPFLFGVSFSLILFLFLGIKSIRFTTWQTSILVYLLTFCLGFTHGIKRQSLPKEHFLHNYIPGERVQLHLMLFEKLRESKNELRFYAKVKSMNGTPTMGKLLIALEKTENERLKLGDHFQAETIVFPLEEPKNPGGFNYKNYLKNKDIHARSFRISTNSIKHIPVESNALLSIKANAIKKIENSSFSNESKELILAMLLGERNTISREKMNDFGDAGILHILAISGLHIGLLLLMLQFVFTPLKRVGKHGILYHLIILGTLWIYALCVGASPSVVRAVTMFSVFSIGALSRRKLPSYYWLLLSYFALLLWNPLFLKQVGFQLSYAAVAGILIVYPKLKSLWKPKTVLLKKFWELSCVSLSAQLAVMPLGLYYFGQFSGLFLLSNWIVLPFLSLFYVLLILSLIGLSFLNSLPQILIISVDESSKFLYKYVGWASDQKSFIWSDVVMDNTQLVVSYTLILLFLYHTYTRQKNIFFSALIILFFGAIYSMKKNAALINHENLWVLHHYGQSTLTYRKGKQIHFYSTAKKEELAYLLGGLKKKFPIKKVEYLELKEAYLHKNTSLIVVKNPSILSLSWPKERPITLLLSHHPKLHLEQLLQDSNIIRVIADGSSPNYIKRKWAKTCKDYGIAFYDTNSDGAIEIIPENVE